MRRPEQRNGEWRVKGRAARIAARDERATAAGAEDRPWRGIERVGKANVLKGGAVERRDELERASGGEGRDRAGARAVDDQGAARDDGGPSRVPRRRRPVHWQPRPEEFGSGRRTQDHFAV